MSDFMVFKNAVNQQIKNMIDLGLYNANVPKDKLWNTYLESFPKGTNKIFRTRGEFDCQCCKQFIKTAGNIVTIKDNVLISIWDINVGGTFQIVADAMSTLVKSTKIQDHFLHYEKNLGTDYNLQQLEDGTINKWNHFHFVLPDNYVKRSTKIGTILNNLRGDKDVFQRSMQEITLDAAETILDLIKQKSLYKGDEYKGIIKQFIFHKKIYDLLEEKQKDNHCWNTAKILGSAARIKNNVIGTLLSDISIGMELTRAVTSFETKVAPANYKRSSAVVSKRMIQDAQNKVEELGISDALQRRYAVTEDLTINNVIYADRTTKKAMNAFDEMIDAVPESTKNLDKVEVVSIDTFIKDVIPSATTIELLLENRHNNNLMSLIAPINKDTKSILKWNNNFSWGYNGEVTDSMKERVKKAGGNVTGELRFSIQWNEKGDNQNDFDAHCIEPCGNLISYESKIHTHTTGQLDVDIITPGREVAVENITWDKVPEGRYIFKVHNYSENGGTSGFRAEIEYKGKIYSYDYPKVIRHKEKVQVAIIEIKNNTLTFIENLPSTISSKQIWGVNTETFNKVNMIMYSPNFWDDQTIGNKHVFFTIDNCINPDASRGFYNEFLKEELHPHRKVFEILGSKMKVESNGNQLSGLGFSSTQRNSILCKVTGSFSRIIKINF